MYCPLLPHHTERDVPINQPTPNDLSLRLTLSLKPSSNVLEVCFLLLEFNLFISFILTHINIGLAVFSVVKAGFVFSGKAGSGLVISRLPDGSWSAPSCIGTAGLGWGLQIGADLTEFVIVLNSDDAVRAFSLGGNVTIGGNISATAGPIGTGGSVQSALAHPAPMFSYSKSKGKSLLH